VRWIARTICENKFHVPFVIDIAKA
jgi:hypothetical protein